MQDGSAASSPQSGIREFEDSTSQHRVPLHNITFDICRNKEVHETIESARLGDEVLHDQAYNGRDYRSLNQESPPILNENLINAEPRFEFETAAAFLFRIEALGTICVVRDHLWPWLRGHNDPMKHLNFEKEVMHALYEAKVGNNSFAYFVNDQAKDLRAELLRILGHWKAEFLCQFHNPDQFHSEFNMAVFGLFPDMRKSQV